MNHQVAKVIVRRATIEKVREFFPIPGFRRNPRPVQCATALDGGNIRLPIVGLRWSDDHFVSRLVLHGSTHGKDGWLSWIDGPSYAIAAQHHPVVFQVLLWMKMMAFTFFHASAILHGKLLRLGKSTLQELRKRIYRSLLCGGVAPFFSG